MKKVCLFRFFALEDWHKGPFAGAGRGEVRSERPAGAAPDGPKKRLAFFEQVCYNDKATFPRAAGVYARLAQLVEHLLDVQEVTGSSPVPSTIQFVLEPDSLRKRVRVRFLFIGGSAEGLLGTVNEQRQGITMIVVSCLLLCGIKFALCELGRPPIWRVWE